MRLPETITLADAPQIPGLRFRRLRDVDDYEQLAVVHRGSQEWDRVDPLSARENVPTAESLASAFPLAEFRDHPDLLLAEVDRQIVGYNHVAWRWTEVTGLHVYLHLGYLLPQWRGKGIGSSMLHWAQGRIGELAAAQQPAGPATYATNVSSTEREADALVQAAGYVAVRRLSDMVLQPLRALPELPLPAGLAACPIAPDHYRELYRAWKDATADVWTSTQQSEDDLREFVADNFSGAAYDAGLCRVAWAGDQVAGFVFARIENGVGTISEVAVRKAWQRRGIARSLMTSALNALHAHRLPQVRLFTNAENEQGARGLYEQLGFREVKQHVFYRKPFDIASG